MKPDPTDEDLFKPLSAKVGRRQWTSGGQEKTAGKTRLGEANRMRQFLLRQKRDADRRAKGSLS